MPLHAAPTFLLASPEPALLATIEPFLLAIGAQVEIVLSAEAALDAVTRPPQLSLALLDENLPGMPMGQLLAAMRAHEAAAPIPVVLIVGTLTPEWTDRLVAGAIDDVIMRSDEWSYWQIRLDLVMRNQRRAMELEGLRDTALRSTQLDRLTGIYNREALLAELFRETERAQRMNSPLSLVLFDLDDFGHLEFAVGHRCLR